MAQEPDPVTPALSSGVPTRAEASSSTPSTSEIRSQIEQTRSEITDTIDAIQERLSPTRLISDAKHSVEEATVGRVKRLASWSSDSDSGRTLDARRIADTVSAHPIPIAMIGLAATAIVVRALRGARNGAGQVTRQPSTENGYRHTSSRGRRRTQRFLAGGVCAGIACWGAWRRVAHAPPSLSPCDSTPGYDFESVTMGR
jgi:hypothetical protein